MPVTLPTVSASTTRTPTRPFFRWLARRASSQNRKPVVIITQPDRPAQKYSQRRPQWSNWMKCMPLMKRCTVITGAA